MIHDAANTTASSVPEELYNLTQLADVTLAAGKLSTTNIQTIKEYIKNDDSTPVTSNAKRPKPITESTVMKIGQPLSSDTSDSSSEINSPQKLLSDAGYMSDIEYLDKKSFLYALHTNHSQSIDTDSSIAESCTSQKMAKSFADQRQSSFSSSEDDSHYNYSHKIFDKRKSRKIHQLQIAEQALKSTNSFKHNAMVIETEDSMLSISEAESNDGEAQRKNETISFGDERNSREKINNELGSETESMSGISGTDDVHTCPECGKKYSTSSNLARHRQTHRSLLDKKARRCPHCDKGKLYTTLKSYWNWVFNGFSLLFSVYVSIPAYSMHLKVNFHLK